MAREAGDAPTLAFVLHQHFDTTRVPHTHAQRLANTAENVALSEAIDDPVALGWAVGDYGFARAEGGDINAAFEGSERQGAIGDEYGIGSFRRAPYLVRGFRALHEGRIADAETYADEAFRVFSETGHRSAFAFYAGQLIAIRRDQGRLDELLDLVTQAAAENPSVVAFRTAPVPDPCRARPT